MRRYATNAECQAACGSQQKQAGHLPMYLTVPAPLSTVSSTSRWKMAIDLAERLLQTVAEEMQDYSDQRSEKWRGGDVADRFHENLEQVNDIRDQLDDLKSEFYLTQQ